MNPPPPPPPRPTPLNCIIMVEGRGLLTTTHHHGGGEGLTSYLIIRVEEEGFAGELYCIAPHFHLSSDPCLPGLSSSMAEVVSFSEKISLTIGTSEACIGTCHKMMGSVRTITVSHHGLLLLRVHWSDNTIQCYATMAYTRCHAHLLVGCLVLIMQCVILLRCAHMYYMSACVHCAEVYL